MKLLHVLLSLFTSIAFSQKETNQVIDKRFLLLEKYASLQDMFNNDTLYNPF